MKEYKWNEQPIVARYFWDYEDNKEYVKDDVPLKERLKDPYDRKIDDIVKDCAIGLAMVMEHVEESDEKIAKIAKVIKGL